jgi:hypothetical protein
MQKRVGASCAARTRSASLLRHQYLVEHSLGEALYLAGLADVHAALQAVLEGSEAAAARIDLRLEDNLHNVLAGDELISLSDHFCGEAG